MLIGDYFDEIGRLIHEHETAGFLLSDDLGYLRATLTFADRSELHVREYVRVSDDRVERLALAYHYQDQGGGVASFGRTRSTSAASWIGSSSVTLEGGRQSESLHA